MTVRQAAISLGLVIAAGVSALAQAPASTPAVPAGLQRADLQRVQAMLKTAREVIRSYYYDRKYHGVDLGAAYDDVASQLKSASSLNVGMTLVAGFLERLHDSHVALLPPPRPYDFDYGYALQPIGDGVFVTGVRPGSDAAGKLNAGDQALLVNNGRTSRATFRTMEYLLKVLQPQPATQLVVRDPNGVERTVLIQTRISGKPSKGHAEGSAVTVDLDDLVRQARESRTAKSRTVELEQTLFWQLPDFEGTAAEMDEVFDTVKGRRALILDLRGNHGGDIATMQHAIGHLFTHNVKIGQNIFRDRKTPLLADGSKDSFAGVLIVLIDAESSSAAEILARVVQLEHRGTVIGDRSAGAVMESRVIPLAQGTGLKMLYAISVTVADLVMSDGHSLEGVGVTPDELLLPTAQDLAAGRDPVLSRAAKLVGIELDPVAAGKLFPFEWK